MTEKGTHKKGACGMTDCDALGFHTASFLLSHVDRHIGSKKKKKAGFAVHGKGSSLAECGQVIMVKKLMGLGEWE